MDIAISDIISKGQLSEILTLQGAKLGGPVWLAVEQQQHWIGVTACGAGFSPPLAATAATHAELSHLERQERREERVG